VVGSEVGGMVCWSAPAWAPVAVLCSVLSHRGSSTLLLSPCSCSLRWYCRALVLVVGAGVGWASA